jgi:hypothetical protein
MHPRFGPIPPAPDCRSLSWWSDADLRHMAEHVGTLWQQWAFDWEIPATEPIAFNACHPDEQSALEPIWSAGSACSGSAACWLETSGEAVNDLLVRVLFGAIRAATDAHGSLTVARELAEQARVELEQALQSIWDEVGPRAFERAGRFGPMTNPKALHGRRWSGTVWLQLPLGSAESDSLWLNLPRLLAARCVRPGGQPTKAATILARPLARVREAMDAEPLRVRAGFTPVQIDLGDLLQLRIGDVIRTPHHLDAPLTVDLLAGTGREARPLCLAHLGARAGDKALALIPINP